MLSYKLPQYFQDFICVLNVTVHSNAELHCFSLMTLTPNCKGGSLGSYLWFYLEVASNNSPDSNSLNFRGFSQNSSLIQSLEKKELKVVSITSVSLVIPDSCSWFTFKFSFSKCFPLTCCCVEGSHKQQGQLIK